MLRRRFLFYSHNEPQQISISYLPWSLAGGTPVADPALEPWPGGTIAQLAQLGHPATRIRESVRARPPTEPESATFRITGNTPVLAITRSTLSGDRVVEVARDIVLPADRTVLDYTFDL